MVFSGVVNFNGLKRHRVSVTGIEHNILCMALTIISMDCEQPPPISTSSNISGRISSVGRALDCRARGRGFNSRDRTNTQGLKMTEK